jgi:hypothetical protein
LRSNPHVKCVVFEQNESEDNFERAFTRRNMDKNRFLIQITSDEKINICEHTGLKSLQKNVDGYIETVGTMDFKSLRLVVFADEEALYKYKQPQLSFNVLVSIMYGRSIYGNCVITNVDDDGEEKGLSKEEADEIVSLLKLKIEKLKPHIKEYHSKYDRHEK